jgi:hypothetical protein
MEAVSKPTLPNQPKASHKRRVSGLLYDTNPDTDNLKSISGDNTLRVATPPGSRQTLGYQMFWLRSISIKNQIEALANT